jgi:signal transduction histidine kinase
VSAILETPSGHLWISTNQGLTEYHPCTSICKSFDVDDGLQGNEFLEGSCFAAPDGHLLFGGINGLNRFVPETLAAANVPPLVVLTAFKTLTYTTPAPAAVGENGVVHLSHRDDYVAFEFVCLDFANPRKNQYAYRLDGFDSAWIDCGPRRYAAYTNLPPGRYQFRVRAASSEGVWSQEDATLALAIAPPPWRTVPFYALVSAMLTAFILALHRYRLRVKVKQSIALERVRYSERERVREQVARDYHDELGHKLAKISLFTELAKRNLDGDRNQTVVYIDKLVTVADTLSREARDFIWTLSPGHETFYDVAVYLNDFGSSLFEEAATDFRVSGIDRRLAVGSLESDVRRHLILIFKEAMTNSLKHARAATVTLAFEADDAGFRITLEDDGVGLDGAVQDRPHGTSGLDNMRRRSERLAGHLEITPRPEGGTRVNFQRRWT